MFNDLIGKEVEHNDYLIHYMKRLGYQRIGNTFTKFQCDTHEVHFKRIQTSQQQRYKGMVIRGAKYIIDSYKLIPNRERINEIIDAALDLLSDMDLMVRVYEDNTIQFVNSVTKSEGRHKFNSLLEAIQKIPASRFDDYATYLSEFYRQINDGIHDFALSNVDYLRDYLNGWEG